MMPKLVAVTFGTLDSNRKSGSLVEIYDLEKLQDRVCMKLNSEELRWPIYSIVPVAAAELETAP